MPIYFDLFYMKAILFYVSLPLIYFISILPFPILYLVSDAFYYLNYYVIGYRKKVVRDNLTKCFPEKSVKEIEKIEKQFFRNLTDLIFETLKGITISRKQALQIATFEGTEILQKYKDANKNIIITGGHCGNYEFINLFLSASPDFPLTVKAVYRKLSNPYFEKLFYGFRTKFGTKMYPTKVAFKAMEEQEEFRPFAFFFVNDQHASPEKAYNTMYLGRKTGFFQGHEIFARKYNLPVFYLDICKTGRGKYHLVLKEICTSPSEVPQNEIIERHVRLLEKNILADIPNLLWSHRRWK